VRSVAYAASADVLAEDVVAVSVFCCVSARLLCWRAEAADGQACLCCLVARQDGERCSGAASQAAHAAGGAAGAGAAVAAWRPLCQKPFHDGFSSNGRAGRAALHAVALGADAASEAARCVAAGPVPCCTGAPPAASPLASPFASPSALLPFRALPPSVAPLSFPLPAARYPWARSPCLPRRSG